MLKRRINISTIKHEEWFGNNSVPAMLYMANALKPPSTTATVPVTKAEASEIR